MRIVIFAIVKMSKFSKKLNRYTKLKVEWSQEPLDYAGMKVACFDSNIGMPVEVYLLFEDAKTGHRPEDGEIDSLTIVDQMNEVGLYVFSMSPLAGDEEF